MYQNVRSLRMPKFWPPLGEMLMWPLPERGAVPLSEVSMGGRDIRVFSGG
jgi:hypothetical protein